MGGAEIRPTNARTASGTNMGRRGGRRLRPTSPCVSTPDQHVPVEPIQERRAGSPAVPPAQDDEIQTAVDE
eukprot:3249986-Alexandrium_andersonii.AAC.1